MKVLFDAYWWVNGPPSGRNVVKSIIFSWAESHDDELTLAVPKDAVSEVIEELGKRSGIHVIPVRLAQHGLYCLLELGRYEGYDVVISQNFVPIGNRSKVKAVFFHDAMPQMHPEWFTRLERLYLAIASRSLRWADVVFTSSKSEARRVDHHNPGLAVQTLAVGLGIPRDFHRAIDRRPDLSVVKKSYLLTVGRINIRKNLGRLIASLRMNGTISQKCPLVVVGNPDGAADAEITGLRDGADVIWTGFVSDSELKWLYQNSLSFVFPSLDEGFGLPILEANSLGVSMALSAIPAFEEFGAVGYQFDPLSSDSINEAVVRSIAQPLPNIDLSSSYNWETTVNRMRSSILSQIERNSC